MDWCFKKSFLIESEIGKLVDPIAYINLPEYDINLPKLYNLLQQFQGRTFKPRERLIICHHETDYYPSLQSCGNTLYNLITMLAYFDISAEHTVIIANDSGSCLQEQVNNLCDMYNISPIKVINFLLWYDYIDTSDRVYQNMHNKKYLYSFVSGLPRTHRLNLLCLLAEKKLLNCGMVQFQQNNNYHNRHQKIWSRNENTNKNEISKDIILRITFPKQTRINQTLDQCAESKMLQIKHHAILSAGLSNIDVEPLDDLLPKDGDVQFQDIEYFYQKSTIHISCETVGNYPQIYFTEKTWKSFANGNALMLYASPGSLAHLRLMGFETFQSLWSEDYDQQPDSFKRAKMIVQELYNLRDEDPEELYNVCRPMIEHNFYHLQKVKEMQMKNLLQSL